MRYVVLRPLNFLNRINRQACLALATSVVFTVLSGCVASDENENDGVSDGSPLVSASTKLSPLDEGDIRGNPVKGELICTFSAGRKTYLDAAGDAATQENSHGIVKFGDQVMEVSSPGGFDSMQHGTLFKGERLAVEVKLKDKDAPSKKAGSNGASSFPAAALTYIRNDSSMRSIDGHWECGP